MKYSKEQKSEYFKTITELRTIGYSWEDIAQEFKTLYGVKWLDPIRKEWQTLNRDNDFCAELEARETYSRVAKAMSKLHTQQKVIAKERNILHKDANTIAFRNLILSHLSNFKWRPYQSIGKPRKVSKKGLKTLNRAVYIIADEHFKGKNDIEHLNYIYNKIQLDIAWNDYKEVELWYLGDGVDGLIHTGSLASNDGAILPMLDYANITIDRINQIPEIKSVKYVSQSNHSQTRPLATSRNELAREDLNYVIIELMKKGLRKDIELVSGPEISFMYDNLSFVMLHGHQPYAKNKEKIKGHWQVCPNVILMGHFHQFKLSEYDKDRWLVVAPTAKNFNGDFEKVNGYISYSQITKMTIKDNIPTFQVMKVGKD